MVNKLENTGVDLEGPLNGAVTVTGLIGTPTGKKPRVGKGLPAKTGGLAGSTERAVVTETVILEDGMKETAKVGLGLAARLGPAWSYIRQIAGWVTTPLMLLIGAVQTKKAINKRDGHEAAKIAGGTVGSIGGMIAADALTGFVLGTVFPGVGNVVGIIIGLVVGIGTAIFGGWFGGKVADGVVGNALHSTLNINKRTALAKNRTAHALQNLAVAREEANAPPSSKFRDQIRNERNKQATTLSPPQH